MDKRNYWGSNIMNTQIQYTYRDASNWKQHEVVVLEGELSTEDIDFIMGKLESAMWFLPEQVGLPRLQPRWGILNNDDHIWHELLREDIRSIALPPTIAMTAQQLVENFRNVHAWDIVKSDSSLWS